MADFKIAIPFVRKWEGGWVNNPNDSGLETYCGISRKYWPKWEGWKLVDYYKPLKSWQVIQDARLEEMVNDFYFLEQWGHFLGSAITDQKVAGFLFDWYVNSKGYAIKNAQRLVGVNDDGVMGPKTLSAINAAGPGLYKSLKEARIRYYQHLVQMNPKNEIFLEGWLNRVNDYDNFFKA